MEDIIKAVRADEEIGVGSCSVVDECYDDDELAEFIEDMWPNSDAPVVVEKLREWVDDYEQRQRDVYSMFS